MLQAEVSHAEQNEMMQIPLGIHRCRMDGAQDLHDRQQMRVAHQRQVDERLDRTLSDLPSQRLVFGAQVLLGGVIRPFDTKRSELVRVRESNPSLFACQRVEPQVDRGGRRHALALKDAVQGVVRRR